MPTPAYTEYNAGLPDGTHSGPTTITDLLNNLLALRDKSMMGDNIAGWTYSQTGGTAEEPGSCTFTNGTLRYRGTPTWTSGYITSILWEWSNDSGSTYSTVFTIASTVDGNGNVTATTGGGGFLFPWVLGLYGKFKALRTTFNTHLGQGPVAAHGAGTMSTQNATAVAITGGSVSCTYEREAIQALANGNASNTMNWSAGGVSTLTVTGTSCTIVHTNLPNAAGGWMILKLVNGGLCSGGLLANLISGIKTPGAGAISLTASGKDRIALYCDDGATVEVLGVSKDVR